MESIIEKISFFFGSFIVLLFCLRYFNEPKYPLVRMDMGNTDDPDIVLEPAFPKFMTKRYQYNLYLIVFVLVTETLYLLLSVYLPYFMGDTGKQVREFGYNALASALIITGVLPNLQFIKGFLEKTKIFLHSKAQIPSKGQDIYQILKNRKIQYSAEKIKQILNDSTWTQITSNIETPSKQFLYANDFSDENRMTTRGKWAKLTYLLFQIEKWSRKPPFKNCVGNCELRWNLILTSYETLKNKMYSYYSNHFNEFQRSELNTKVDTLMLRTYRLISCLLFIADKNSCELNDYMNELGYNPQDPPIFAIPFSQLAFAAISTGVGILTGAVLTFIISITLDITFLTPSGIGFTTGNLLLWICYGIPFLTFPVLFVLLVKRHLSFKENRWPLATPRDPVYTRLKDRPWLIYIAVSAGAFLVAFFTLIILNACFNLLQVQPNQSELSQIRIFLIWSLVGMITAAFVSYRIDSISDYSENKVYKTVFAVIGSLFQAFTTSATIYFAYMHVANNGSLNFLLIDNPEKKARLCVYLIMGFFIGAALFLTSQFNTKQYERRTHRRKSENNEIDLVAGDQSMKGVLLNSSKGGGLVKSGVLNKNVGEKIKITTSDNVTIDAEIVKFENENVRLRFEEGANQAA